MAHITKKKGSKKLYIDFYLNGERKQKSTRLDDTPENRRIVENEMIPALEAKITLGMFSTGSTGTWRDYGKVWMDSKKDDESYHQKKWVWQKVIDWGGDRLPRKITKLDCKRYLASLNIKTESKRPYLTALIGIFETALDDRAVDKNEAIGIKLKIEEKEEVAPFSPEEVNSILKAAIEIFYESGDDEDENMIDFLGVSFYQGMRSGEVLALMPSDVNHDEVSVRRGVTKGKVSTPKTRHSKRTIKIFDGAKPYIENRLKKRSMYLFMKNGKHYYDVSSLHGKWEKILSKAEVRYRTIYNTRHTFITAMILSGQYSLLDIAKISGHKNIRMLIERYSGFIEDHHLKVDTKVDIFSTKMA